MTRPELGTKRVCVGCAVRFYDLTHAPPTCPKCGAIQPPDVPRPRYGGRGTASPRRAPWQAAPAPALDGAEPGIAATEDDEDDIAAEEDEEPDAGELDAEVPLCPGAPE